MDVFNSRFYDFDALSLNHGHQNPLILKALRQQLNKLTLTSRAFYNDQLGQTAEYLGKEFKYAQVLLMNSGLEAAESAIKIARKWAYEVKGVPDGQARILFAKGNNHGNSIAMLAATNDTVVSRNFGPYGGLNFDRIEYNHLEDLELTLQREPNYAAFMIEPIQTESGVNFPNPGYLKEAKRICQKYNVLLIADELYTGLGRTGKLLASEWEKVKPDIAIIGESLGGGIYPISAVMGPKKVMKVLTPGTHGSTFGGNPLGCVIARTSVQIIRQQEFLTSVKNLSKIFGDLLNDIKSPLVGSVDHRGLLGGIEIEPSLGVDGAVLANTLAQRGVLAKVVGDNVLRLAPPLVISEQDLINGMKYVRLGIKDCEKEMDKDKAKIIMAIRKVLNPPPPKEKKPVEKKKKKEDTDDVTTAGLIDEAAQMASEQSQQGEESWEENAPDSTSEDSEKEMKAGSSSDSDVVYSSSQDTPSSSDSRPSIRSSDSSSDQYKSSSAYDSSQASGSYDSTSSGSGSYDSSSTGSSSYDSSSTGSSSYDSSSTGSSSYDSSSTGSSSYDSSSTGSSSYDSSSTGSSSYDSSSSGSGSYDTSSSGTDISGSSSASQSFSESSSSTLSSEIPSSDSDATLIKKAAESESDSGSDVQQIDTNSSQGADEIMKDAVKEEEGLSTNPESEKNDS